MANRLTKLPAAVAVPAVQAVQGRAAYCTKERVQTGYTSNTVVGVQYVAPDPILVDQQGRWIQTVHTVNESPVVPIIETVVKCYPAVTAVEGQPARIDYTANTGWNGGARSIKQIPTFGSLKGTLGGGLVATQLGFSDRYFDYTYRYMRHSIVARPGEWAVVEQGITKATGVMGDRATLELRRVNGRVTYVVDGAEVYQSGGLVLGEVYGASLLYSLADSIDNAAILDLAPVTQLQVKVPPFRLLLSTSDNESFFDAELPTWVLSAQMAPQQGVNNLELSVPQFLLVGADRFLSFLTATLPTPQLSAVMGRPERSLTQLVLSVPAPILSATSAAGESVSLDVATPKFLLAAADHAYSFMDATLPGIVTLSVLQSYLPTGIIDGMEGMVSYDTATLESALVLLAVDSLDVGSTEANLVIIVELAGMDSLGLSDSTSIGQLIELLAMEQVAVNSATSTAQQAIQYAVNAVTGALATYDGYDFLGFTSTQRDTYAWKADGLYRIGASTDNGELIRALIDFGTTDYATAAAKRVPTAYMGVRTDGQVFLRVQTDEGRERTYRAVGQSNVRRSELAKGVVGRYWSVKLDVVDASFCEVDSLELAVGVTIRRGFGLRG